MSRKPLKKVIRPSTISSKSEGQSDYIRSILSNDITFCSGPPGSGKSLLAVCMAIQLLNENKDKYRRLIMVRPAVTACDENIGYLPGDLDEKMAPFVAPLMDSLRFCLNDSEIDLMVKTSMIEIVPIAYMRGRSLHHSIVIFDEAQNSTISQMKMFLTRIGQDCKVIVEGDVEQSDLAPSRGLNGLTDAIERLRDVDGIGVVRLAPQDIVRSAIIRRILERYE